MVFNLEKAKKAISLLVLLDCKGAKYIPWAIRKLV